MKAYRHSTNLKLGLVLFAVVIAVASLMYTNRLVKRLRDREQLVIQLRAKAQEQVLQTSMAENPYREEFRRLEGLLQRPRANARGEVVLGIPRDSLETYRRAMAWVQTMPPEPEVTLASEIITRSDFGIPTIIIDSTQNQPVAWQHVPVPDTLDAGGPARDREMHRLFSLAAEMSDVHEPIPYDLGMYRHYIFYGESGLIRELRVFPYIQLVFVGLFILVGYLGFSYVRRSEQSSLWVGMAKEAAHQLGTPLSSLMGWTELMRADGLTETQQTAVREIEDDITRLRRVASRFSDIGSLPKLVVQPLAPVIDATADYIRRRIPERGKQVGLRVNVPPSLKAPLNPELFEWVVENLLKNALDAIDAKEGHIDISAVRQDDRVVIDVHDSGKGIDRRDWKNVFRPGYSTKKRGWGLGLSLAKRIVEDYHGGSLTLHESRVGHGTTFRIEVPVG